MPLKDTVRLMRMFLGEIQGDIDRAERGNKAASQRVRTNSIRFSKLAKVYRKESLTAEQAIMRKTKRAKKPR